MLDKADKLYDFIKNSKEFVTVDFIADKLGKNYLGALGKLLASKRIEKVKEKPVESYTDGRFAKHIRGYRVLGLDITEEDLKRKDIVNFAKDEAAEASGEGESI